MMSVIEIERNGGGRKDASKIIDKTERGFFMLFSRLLEKMPGSTIVHEPTLFETQSDEVNGGTLPDFLITRPDGRKIYIEITRSRKRNPDSVIKQKQRKIMEAGAPDYKYVVLHGEILENIQKKHPEIDLFLK